VAKITVDLAERLGAQVSREIAIAQLGVTVLTSLSRDADGPSYSASYTMHIIAMVDATAKLIAFLATVDSAKSRAFYENVVGLRCISEDQLAVVYDAHGTDLRVQNVKAFTPQSHTALGWSVGSIERVIAGMRAKGVAFERYAFLEQDDQGIWTAPSGAKVAWFKDPDGNLLSVTER
jgi:catechol 2,3-dioxygenase-like lactoylglutathione lyase family enzyme